MKKNNLFLLLTLFIFACGSEEKAPGANKSTEETTSDTIVQDIPLEKSVNDTNFISGDVIFQTNYGEQSDLITIVTQSPFTHCGIILKDNSGYKVLEANGTVKQTPLKDWVGQGKDGKYVVMRFKYEKDFQSKEYHVKAVSAIKAQLNKPYDSKFMWADDKMYCSEMVWKLYKETTGHELCSLKKLKDYTLSSEEVKAELKNRYGNDIPMEEPMVAPSDIAASAELDMIFSNY